MTLAALSGNFMMPTSPLPEAPPDTRDPEKVGVARVTVVAVCCPACSSLHVLRRSWRMGKPYAWWQCQEDPCQFMWREALLIGTAGRAAVVG